MTKETAQIIDINNHLHKKILSSLNNDCLVSSIKPIHSRAKQMLAYCIQTIDGRFLYTNYHDMASELNRELLELKTNRYKRAS